MLLEFFGSLWFFIPIGVSNMAPVFASKLLGPGRPVDSGRKFLGKPILGKNKTWQGFFWGTLMGGLFFLLQKELSNQGILSGLDVVGYASIPWWIGFSMAFGSLFGDSAKSFVKRRLNFKPGKSWIPWDQLDYVLGAFLFTLPFVSIPFEVWITVLIVYPLLHIAVSFLGYKSGVKKDSI